MRVIRHGTARLTGPHGKLTKLQSSRKTKWGEPDVPLGVVKRGSIFRGLELRACLRAPGRATPNQQMPCSSNFCNRLLTSGTLQPGPLFALAQFCGPKPQWVHANWHPANRHSVRPSHLPGSNKKHRCLDCETGCCLALASAHRNKYRSENSSVCNGGGHCSLVRESSVPHSSCGGGT